jgi:hypothetical protein
MERLSIGTVAGATFNFVLRNYLVLLGSVWLPVGLHALLAVFVIIPATAAMTAAIAHGDVGTITASLGNFFLGEAAAVMLTAIAAAAVTRLAMGHTPRWPFVYSAFDRDVGRFLLSAILFALLCLLVFFIALLLFGVAIGLGSFALAGNAQRAGQYMQLLRPVLTFGIYVPLILILVRLGMLLPPVALTERIVGLGRSLSLSRGNFWRMLAVLFLVVLPLLVLGIAQIWLLSALGGGQFPSSFTLLMTRLASGLVSASRMPVFPYIYIPWTIMVSPISYGLVFGAGTFCYRALVPAASADAAEHF